MTSMHLVPVFDCRAIAALVTSQLKPSTSDKSDNSTNEAKLPTTVNEEMALEMVQQFRTSGSNIPTNIEHKDALITGKVYDMEYVNDLPYCMSDEVKRLVKGEEIIGHIKVKYLITNVQ